MRKIDKIIIHCSDSDVGEHDRVNVIRDWHLARGWSDIGYHFYISKINGIEFGRPIKKAGAHTMGENKHSIGICLGGRRKFTDKQIEKAQGLTSVLMNIFDLSINDVYGHNEFNINKTCPNINMALFKEGL